MPKTAILLSNIGTTAAPTPQAVARYLKEFLSDRRVIELPKWFWQPLLRYIILPTRSKRSAKLYQKIWQPEGSPLLVLSKKIAEKLSQQLNLPTQIGMRYGHPSISQKLQEFTNAAIEHLIVIPLFPQFSATTTSSVFDTVTKYFHQQRYIPKISFLSDYATNNFYIEAIAASIQHHWQVYGKKFLLFSFHGIPQRYADLGDPYPQQCQASTQLIADQLHLNANEWSLAFQSRLGPTSWLKPYTDKLLVDLPKKGIKEIQVITPGFAVDCLETLEELALTGKKLFFAAGGTDFEYIPALNDSDYHIEMLTNLIKPLI